MHRSPVRARPARRRRSVSNSAAPAQVALAALWCAAFLPQARTLVAADHLRELQQAAIDANRSPVAHWGIEPNNYQQWGTHSNRLTPLYTWGTRGAGPGVDLDSYLGANSVYRKADAVRELYGYDPADTVNPAADYCDQTDIYRQQEAAAAAGKKYIFLVIFDGMDWQTTRAAAIYQSRAVEYDAGRGRGLHILSYLADQSQFGFMVTSPHNEGTTTNVDTQAVERPFGDIRGGYNPARGGTTPWGATADPRYLIAQPEDDPARHAYTDSSSSATSMTAGIKTFNNGVNVDYAGRQVRTIVHDLQDRGFLTGVVSSVPISHATPAAAYAHNVERDDYQDLTRDLLGLPSIAHPVHPLPGLDVVLGGGADVNAPMAPAQGGNFVPGNLFLTDADRQAVDSFQGGKYVVCGRTSALAGAEGVQAAARIAVEDNRRLLGMYGVGGAKGHLPYATADGDFKPADGRNKAEVYSPADIDENPTLAEMTTAALTVLQRADKGFWLMVEPGDVDWANHDNNLDNSIGAVLSGDAAVKVITDWVEAHSNWEESLLIVTADHGHMLSLLQPEGLIPPAK